MITWGQLKTPMGLLKVLEGLPFLTTLSRWVYGLTALFCLALAVSASWITSRPGGVSLRR